MRSDPSSDSTAIELDIGNVVQLFDAFDPSPIAHRDLNSRVEEYLIESIGKRPVRSLAVRLPESAQQSEHSLDIPAAVRAHFVRRSIRSRRKLRQLTRRGLISLLIGMSFLVIFYLGSRGVVLLLGENTVAKLVTESLIIGGWVALWRPLDTFLYDLWPLFGERRAFDMLSRMEVRVSRTP